MRADGVLKPEITPATLCPWIDFNINSQLNKFGLRNGPPALPTKSLLNEKWESLVLVPVDNGKKDEYFLIAISDNDFITQNGKFSFWREDFDATLTFIRIYQQWQDPLQRREWV